MSSMQRAYAVGRLPDLPLGAVECLMYIEFRGGTAPVCTLQRAVEQVHRHAALRGVLDVEQGVLRDGDAPAPQVVVHDVAHDPAGCRERIRRDMMRSGIDIGRGRNWSVSVSQGAGDDRVLHTVFSLAALDVAAIGVVLDDLARACQDPGEARDAVPASVAAVRELVTARACPRPRQAPGDGPLLLGGADVLGLSTDVAAGSTVTTLRHHVDELTWSVLERRAEQHGVSLAVLLLTLYERAVRAWSSNPDFCLTVAGLDVRGTEDLVTDRTMAYAHRAFDAPSFTDALDSVACDLRRRLVEQRDAMTEMREAQVAHRVVEPSRFVFTYAVEREVFTSRTLEVLGTPTTWAQTPQSAFDLRLIRVGRNEVEVTADVRDGALPEDVRDGIFALLLKYLDEVVADGAPGDWLLPEQAAVRDAANATPGQPPALLHSGVRDHLAQHGDALAVVESTSGRGITYRELDELALQVAGRVAAVAAPGDLVAVQMSRGIDQVATILGVLYAGCAYLPLGPDAPAARVDRIRKRSGWAALVTDDGGDLADVGAEPLAEPVPVAPEALAYVLFTSGSTGEPKGVAISHRAARNTLDDLRLRHGFTADDVMLAVSGIDFDLSVHDIFGTFAAGARLIMVEDAERRDPFAWSRSVREHGVTVWNTVPMLLEMLLAAAGPLPSLRVLLVSGDWIPLDLPARSRELAPASRFVAMGGATEAAIWSNEYVVESDEDLPPHWPSVPYGLPLGGQKYRVVDHADRDLPDRRVGELLIGGLGVADGYYNDPGRTSTSFVTDAAGERWYRTGDLGMWCDGLIFFAGRRDSQVKIRGHRIECGEVEAKLTDHPQVAQAVVVPIRRRTALGAVVVPRGEERPDVEDLVRHVGGQVPSYMIPARIVTVPQIPVTTNGKTDRSWAEQLLDGALPVEDGADPSTLDVHLATILAAWGDQLGVVATAESNFFELGGDSLAATRMCSVLRGQGIGAELADLFRAPTAAGFAAACRERGAPGPATDPPQGSRKAAPWQDDAAAQGLTLETAGLVEWCRWMWHRVLSDGADQPVDVTDDADFFQLGGDSLRAARLCADLVSSGVAVSVAKVFRHPRFGDFAERCAPVGDVVPLTDDVERIDPSEAFDLTDLQLSYALGSDGIPGVVRTNPCVAVVLASEDPQVQERWGRALAAVVRRHDALSLVRSEDFRQRVAPRAEAELVEVPFSLDDKAFRELLQTLDVEATCPPAVRAVIRRDRPDELGLVFNYLALDSTSIALVLADLAASATGADLGPETVPVDVFRRHAGQAPLPPSTSQLPSPRIPAAAIPSTPVGFTSVARVLPAETVTALHELARSKGVTVSSVVLRGLAQALASATGRPGVTINIPTAHRPIDAPDAMGQFTRLALCEITGDMDLRQTHETVGRSIERAGRVGPGRSTERQRYPVVFTSLVGAPLSRPLAGGAVRLVWTHTRTPAVLIDCQVTPMPAGEIEIRWDMPEDILDPAFVEPAFVDFYARVTGAVDGREIP
ncbi:amino acid adenylation domain-containing protein [Arsenicicoccus dermatophilus]|uniref:amino acid adenylation domain-containing protein n=1 Tax=Arsenicicoccus dermatophilus TaxID=1076331 RepID=UPI001F4C84EA|nr:amino acid adenylation domain-containing protein [Arsenicicoccus dermatophilus]MCH8614046.1 amino acid adenylation domain-containing protein [Arsenicicoccus dermatophilus]